MRPLVPSKVAPAGVDGASAHATAERTATATKKRALLIPAIRSLCIGSLLVWISHREETRRAREVTRLAERGRAEDGFGRLDASSEPISSRRDRDDHRGTLD